MSGNVPADPYDAIQAAVNDCVQEVHQPILDLLNQSPANRDHGLLPRYIHQLDGLITWLTTDVKGKLPMQLLRNHWQRSLSLREQLGAIHQNLLNTVQPVTDRQTVAIPGGGYSLALNIPLFQQLEQEGFTDVEIAQHLGCSRSTVRRRRKALGQPAKRLAKHQVPEEIIERHVRDCINSQDGIMVGYRKLQGYLEGMGIPITREHARELNRALDPDGVRLRKAVLRKRWVYKVPFPNSLWHVDGQHKLIRWKFVIHGGVDGYSRVCVFMRAGDNNRAETVERLFMEATKEWGWPQRVRVDFGKENYGIWRQMSAIREAIKAPFIRGKSTSNTPIERHWKEVGEKFTHKYSRTFADLEYREELDPDSPVDIFCLHHCFLPLLNLTIQRHVLAHNHHKSTTAGERGWTPRKKWLDGTLKAKARGMDLNLFPSDSVVDKYGFIDEILSGDDSEDDLEQEGTQRPSGVTSWLSEQRQEDLEQPRRNTDPYVEVKRYHELLPPLLQDPGFRQALALNFPPATEHLPEEGDEGLFSTFQYIAVREWVHDCLLADQ